MSTPDRREAARLLGSAKSARKTAAARQNARKGGRPRWPRFCGYEDPPDSPCEGLISHVVRDWWMGTCREAYGPHLWLCEKHAATTLLMATKLRRKIPREPHPKFHLARIRLEAQ